MFPFYVETAFTAFRRQLIYRWANISGLITNIFFCVLFSYVLLALYHVRPSVPGYSIQDSLRYTWLLQSLLMVITPFGWMDLMMTIRTGEVVSDLSKPCDFCWYWFSREVGRSLYFLFFRGLPIYTAGMLLFQIGLPMSWSNWGALLLMLPSAILLGIVYRFLYNLLAFWIIEGRAIVTMAVVLSLFFTGSYVPIYFLPSWLQNIVAWLPFNGFMNVPTLAFLGKMSLSTFWFELARQIGWLLLLVLVARLLTTIATRRVVSQGARRGVCDVCRYLAGTNFGMICCSIVI
ncbi:ABC transporter permease [Ktedonospora formicarum]|uniref:ABC transporter permease n=1 Tax=Ktedonospora formicarum TaxID=2778364 RepID=A0A8J3HZD1_9CHLR|nr:hypothetical protein [Ktedonospora formicarum]GHO42709.1 ABC transporter permease [Ktedonospora formicarum]